MINDKFKDYCSTIDSVKYHNIQTASILASAGVLVGDIALSQVYPDMHNLFTGIFCASMVLPSYICAFDGRRYGTDIQEIRKIYDDFIKKYNELNKMFNFKNPIEIYMLYTYLYDNGYLSNNKSFEHENRHQKDVPLIFGTEIINGKGVCRHISAMLSDILNDYGILSTRLTINTYYYHFEPVENEKGKYSRDEIIKWANENIVYEDSLHCFLSDIKKSKSQRFDVKYRDDSFNPINKIIGNHSITYANYDGHNYFLDPTQKQFFKRCNNDKSLYSWFNRADIKKPIRANYDEDRYNRCMELINSGIPSISLEEMEDIRYKTRKTIESNTDIFEDFYHENKDFYSEISNRLLRVK